jgi:hypothetical protein
MAASVSGPVPAQVTDDSTMTASAQAGMNRAEAREAGGQAPVLPVTHELKSWPEFFEEVRSGRKMHELRRADDRCFRVGDYLVLREYDPRREAYTGRRCRVQVTYITSASVPCAFFDVALDPRYCILSVARVGEDA